VFFLPAILEKSTAIQLRLPRCRRTDGVMCTPSVVKPSNDAVPNNFIARLSDLSLYLPTG
jgi:hypothetical protein